MNYSTFAIRARRSAYWYFEKFMQEAEGVFEKDQSKANLR